MVGTHCAMDMSVRKYSVIEGSTVLTILPSSGPIMLPSMTAARMAHFASGRLDFACVPDSGDDIPTPAAHEDSPPRLAPAPPIARGNS